MSVEKALREMVAEEVARAVGPLQAALAELQGNQSLIARLASALGLPLQRGRGSPVKSVTKASGARRGRKATEKRECAVIDCGKPARSKGYCSAHYQKFHMLDRTGRLPPDWVANALPNSVQNFHLPRGRVADTQASSSESLTELPGQAASNP